MTKKFDIAVIGSSISGSVFSYLMGARGAKVALIDARDFSKAKACGEGLSIMGKRYLERLGLWNSQLEASSRPFLGYTLFLADGRKLRLQKNRADAPEGFAVHRPLLDHSLCCAACDLPSVRKIRQNAVMCARAGTQWEVTLTDGEIVRADYLVCAAASGVTRLFENFSSCRSGQRRYSCTFWCRGSWTGGTPNEVIVVNRPGRQAVLTPLSDTELNASILIDADAGIGGNRAAEEIDAILASLGFVAEFRPEPLGSPRVHSERMPASHEPVFLIGDAAERFDALGGLGMTHAIFSAALAAEKLDRVLEGDAPVERALVEYERARSRGSVRFRLLTGLSRAVNVRENKIACFLARYAPRFALFMLGAIKNSLPLHLPGKPIIRHRNVLDARVALKS